MDASSKSLKEDAKRKNHMVQIALHLAAKDKNVKEIKRLLSLGADVNFSGKYTWTPLHVAASYNKDDSHFETIELLLSNGADANAQNNQAKTPLHYLVKNAKLKTLNLLLNFVADVNKKDSEGCTPMFLAVDAGNADAVKLLLNFGFDINQVDDEYGSTTLHLSAHLDVIEILLKNGANVNALDHQGNTPLHCLVSSGTEVEVLQLLLDFEADLNIKNVDGKTPLWEATKNSNDEIIQFLIDHGSDVNGVDKDGSTLLHFAGKHYAELRTIKLLVKNGADVDAVDSEGCTPLLKEIKTDRYSYHLKFFLKHADVNCIDAEDNNILNQLPERDLRYNQWWILILKHFAKLQVLGLTIHSSVLETIFSTQEYDEYFNKCLDELELARNIKLHNTWITFFNLLVDSNKKLRNYAGNEDIVKDFENTNCSNKFPVYGAEIHKRMKKAIRIRKLYDESTVTLCDFIPIFNSDHLIIRDIKDCLQENDYGELAWMYRLTRYFTFEDDKEEEEEEGEGEDENDDDDDNEGDDEE